MGNKIIVTYIVFRVVIIPVMNMKNFHKYSGNYWIRGSFLDTIYRYMSGKEEIVHFIYPVIKGGCVFSCNFGTKIMFYQMARILIPLREITFT